MKSKIAILFTILILIITSGFSCKCSSPEVAEKTKPIKLTWWRPWDSSADVSDIINAYTQLHPHVSISYKKFRYEEYEDALINGWAQDEGPDIFSLNNSWLRKYQKNIAPPPEETAIPRIIVTGPSFKQTRQIVIQTQNFLKPNDIKNIFVPSVYNDVVIDDQVLALPLSVDTLALYYNRDLLNKAGIPKPPATWIDFKDAVKKLTLLDVDEEIIQAGAGIGSGKNVTRSTDILALLMLQNGTNMSAINQSAGPDNEFFPGIAALDFYTNFSDPTKETYTWNSQMPESLDAFINGQSAMFFGYAFHLPTIQARAPKLNFNIAPMVQISNNQNVAINIANYWLESVSKKTSNAEVAWDFLMFAATEEEYVKQYLDKSRKPTALRSLILEQEKDYDLKPFVSQLLTAKSWYQGNNFNQVEVIFNDMIQSVVDGLLTAKDATARAAEKIRQTY